MTKRSKRMLPVKGIAEAREKDASRQLGEYGRILSEREARLQELKDYRDTMRDPASSGTHMDPVRLQEYRLFLARLNEAVHQQEKMVASSRDDYESKRRYWLDKRTHAKALDKVVDRFETHERQQAARNEQRQLDEAAASTRATRKNDLT